MYIQERVACRKLRFSSTSYRRNGFSLLIEIGDVVGSNGMAKLGSLSNIKGPGGLHCID